METTIGVFSSRELGQDAMRKLIEQNVPQESIVFLTRSETESETFCRHLGAAVGAFAGIAIGMSAGVGVATMLALPAIWHMFAFGFGSAALVGLAGAGVGALMGRTVACHSGISKPAPNKLSAEDTPMLGDVRQDWSSLIVVRTEAQETAQVAGRILDPLGSANQQRASAEMQPAAGPQSIQM